MIVLCGAMLAAGVLLALAPWLWPLSAREERQGQDSAARRLLDAAGYAHSPTGRFAAVSIGVSLLAGALAWLTTSLTIVAILATCFGAASPTLWLRSRSRRRRRARRAMWPDVCEQVIASVRAGMALPEALASLSTVGPSALRPAFGRFAADFAASGHFDSAALRLKAALGDPIADRIIETLRMARQVGGTELTTVLRALAASVRADAALRGEVEARQSWTRGAAVLGVAAPWLVLALLATRPEGAKAYGSAEGMILVTTGAGLSALAYHLMMRVGRLPEPQRWFG